MRTWEREDDLNSNPWILYCIIMRLAWNETRRRVIDLVQFDPCHLKLQAERSVVRAELSI